MPLRLTWDRTFPDAKRDFNATDGPTQVGRIYQINYGSLEGQWFWVMHARIGNRYHNQVGHLASKDEAARRVEEEYFKVKGDG